MKILIIILNLIPLVAIGQKQYDTIYVKNYVSTPPLSEVICDTFKCEGSCISYYKNGQVHKKGKFEKGQPIDTLFTFYSNGVIQELAVPVNDDWKLLTYYNNGQLKAYYYYPKRSITKYYVSGNLEAKENWNRKFKSRLKKYHENGTLIYKEKFNKQKVYDSAGVLRKSIKRREIFRLERMRSKERPFYTFRWNTYNSNGERTRTLTFSGSEFPMDLYEIDTYLFDKIIFFNNGINHKKLTIQSQMIANTYTRYFVLYTRHDGKWKKGQEIPLDDIYDMIETLSKDNGN